MESATCGAAQNTRDFAHIVSGSCSSRISSVTTRSRPLPCPNERSPADGVEGEDRSCHSGDPGLTSSKSEENSCSISWSMSRFCWAMKEIVMRCSKRRILEREGRSSGARRMQSIIRPLNPSGTCENGNETAFYQRNHGNKETNFRFTKRAQTMCLLLPSPPLLLSFSAAWIPSRMLRVYLPRNKSQRADCSYGEGKFRGGVHRSAANAATRLFAR